MKRIIWILLVLAANIVFAASPVKVKNVLILVEGNADINSMATAEGRQLAQLMGHFKTNVTIKGINKYAAKELNNFDYTFFIGYSEKNQSNETFQNDVYNTEKPVIWINTGFSEFCEKFDVKKKWGFNVTGISKTLDLDQVIAGNKSFTKGNPNIGLVQITDKKLAQVKAQALSSKTKKSFPYIINSKNLYYIGDSPFEQGKETDRYLLFADMLHDILNEQHAEAHQAMIRIEDVTPMDNPDKIRDIADILSAKDIPFLIAFVPIYVNPSLGMRVSLSDKPEMVDALKYAIRNGASIVMHGVTHQYRGTSTDDFEFWDANRKGIIKEESEDQISKKLEMGIKEFMKNGIFPLAWETPHYTASELTYKTVAKYFSTAVEQRLVINNFESGQAFPYIINKDIYGQTIFPENLGYIPLNPDHDASEKSVNMLISNAKTVLNVRDGFATCFFHSFLDLDLLKDLVDGIKDLGYNYVDISDYANSVKTSDRVILSGATQTYKVTLNNNYLWEAYFNQNGDITKRIISEKLLKGVITKTITLKPGETYKAEPIDYKIKDLTFTEKIAKNIKKAYTDFVTDENQWNEARVSVLWNQYARGAAYNDQSSFISAFKSLNIIVDTVFIHERVNYAKTNLLIVPFASVDSLSSSAINEMITFVKGGGNLITDQKNKLAAKLGINFTNSDLKIHGQRDHYYPEEYINWKYAQLAYKFELTSDDEIFSEDVASGTATVIGREMGNGKFIYFNTAFDPYSKLGYSRYPYIMDYVKRYFKLHPVFRRDNLEFFFDPGFRQNTSVENLVKQWVNQGIRIIHVASWHQYPKYTYDYARLIKIAHANGILVNAWIEPPQVSKKFYMEHPEWREKNYMGEDVRPEWRYPMALTDEKCLQAVIKEYDTFLSKFDFDGVNIAELYFASDEGFTNPKLYTPMHISAQQDVMKKYNFNLKDIFNPGSPYFWQNNSSVKQEIIKYRVDKTIEIHARLLESLKSLQGKRAGFHIIVTTMDNHLSPNLKSDLGVDVEEFIKLQNKYNFTLNIQDAMACWSTDPTRYQKMGEYYAAKSKNKNNIMLDLNIMSFRTKEEILPFPTLEQTGVESYQLVSSSALGVNRFLIYSEATANPQDIACFANASSSAVKYSYTDEGYEVNSPTSFQLKLPKTIKYIHIDGVHFYGSRDNVFLIPAGKHSISVLNDDLAGFTTDELQPHIFSFTGNLLDVAYEMRKATFNYESDSRALITINRKPNVVTVDDQAYKFEVMKGNDCFTIFLPAGKHKVSIETGDELSNSIDLTSFWSSKSIAIFGAVAVTLLLIMYIGLKIIRKVKE